MAASESTFADGRFTLIRRVNVRGSVFLAYDRDCGTNVALKLEASDCPHPNLRFEYKLAGKLQGNAGIPQVLWFGQSGEWTGIARELLGPSLMDLFLYCGRIFSLKTVLMLADQVLARVELCHSRDYVHRNISPRHFLIGLETAAHCVHIIGLERCKRYRHKVTRRHIPVRGDRKLVADPQFASLNMLLGVEVSRRDDLEAVGYMLLFFLRGKLPWRGVGSGTREALALLKSVKLNASLQELCKHVPSEFQTYLEYCRSLKFEEKPDYSYIKRLFRECLELAHYSHDFIFDWTVYHYNKYREKHNRDH